VYRGTKYSDLIGRCHPVHVRCLLLCRSNMYIHVNKVYIFKETLVNAHNISSTILHTSTSLFDFFYRPIALITVAYTAVDYTLHSNNF